MREGGFGKREEVRGEEEDMFCVAYVCMESSAPHLAH